MNWSGVECDLSVALITKLGALICFDIPFYLDIFWIMSPNPGLGNRSESEQTFDSRVTLTMCLVQFVLTKKDQAKILDHHVVRGS